MAVLLLAYVGVLLISCANDDVLHGYPAWHVFELGLGSLARFHGYASVLGLLVEVLAVSLLVVGAIKFLFDRNRVGLLVLAIGWLVWGGLTYVRVQPVLTEVRAGNDEVRQLARSAGALDDDVVAQVRALAKDDRAMRVFHEMRRRQAEGVLRTMDSAAVATMEVRMHMGRTLEALLERRVSERSDVVLFLPSILVGLFLVSGAVLLRRR